MLNKLVCKRNLVFLAALGMLLGLALALAACTQTASTTTAATKPATGTPAASAVPVAATSPGATLPITIEVSKPANGTHLVAGEKATITITLKDQNGAPLNREDFATLNLYAYGPQETLKTVTAVKLLNANTDRTKTPHHLIDLIKDTNVQVSGNVLKYALQAVSNEEPGTYTASVYAVKLGTPAVGQTFALADFQVGTATPEKQIVEKANCAPCHLGTTNNQFYMHHVDPGRSPYGSPSLDSVPVRTCKSCHNNDGYAAFTPAGGTATPDNIVIRAHGVHFGEGLTNPANTDPKTGVFRNYAGVVFPLDILNCTACHTDDRWKTQPSRQACGACHDGTWFGDAATLPKGLTLHKGGPQGTDAACAGCHPADTGGVAAVAKVHDPKINLEYDQAVLTMSSPANGKFYAAGEKPVVTMVIKDANGQPIDHTKVVPANYSAANLFVYGPRENSKPVLTLAAKNGNSQASASVTNAGLSTKGWTFADGDTFKIAVNGGAVQELKAPAGIQTPDQVRDWLKANLKDVNVTSNNTTGAVTIASTIKGDKSEIDIYNSPVTTKMTWKPLGLDIKENGIVVGKTAGVTMEPYVLIGNVSTAGNDLRGTTDPAVVRTAANITYQLDDVAGLQPGTYMVLMYADLATVNTKNGWQRAALGEINFQIGTETPDLKIATCTRCHGNTVMHLNESRVHPATFDADWCKACHDYNRTGTGDLFPQTGGNSTSGWAGYGAKPISARVHGVHRGLYLEHPEYVYAGDPNKFSEVIFPQDIRNCTVCHDAKSTSTTWKDKPSRLACTGCHDSDAALGHTLLMTRNPNPADPYGPKAVETCEVCHGPGKDFAVEKVHNIANPYVPPYLREPVN